MSCGNHFATLFRATSLCVPEVMSLDTQMVQRRRDVGTRRDMTPPLY